VTTSSSDGFDHGSVGGKWRPVGSESGMFYALPTEPLAAQYAQCTFTCGCTLQVDTSTGITSVTCPHGNFIRPVER
jgi:hypothetical protein